MHKRSENTRDEHNRWDIGGGGLKFGEFVEDRLRNEIKEEYDADVLEYEFLGYRDVHREHDRDKTHWIALDFKVLVDKEQVTNGEPHNFSEVMWFTMDKKPEDNLLHSQLPIFFENYKDKLI